MTSSTVAPNAAAESLATALRQLVAAPSVVRASEPLAKRTTMKIGGPADVYVEPGSTADLAAVLVFCGGRKLPWMVLGRGSNLLILDGGFQGVVISLNQPHFSRIEVSGNELRCGAGARLKDVAHAAKQNDLGGLEFLEGIPGTVGGGLRMNAGAMGGAMFDAVRRVELMDAGGAVRECTPAEMEVDYRRCSLLRNTVAISALLRATPAERTEIEQRMNAFSSKRWTTQPAIPSAGCIFKNPASIPAGKLIDELGLKGTRVGGAAVSLKHGNFLVNEGSATARDVCQLIELIQAKARAERGIELETEVQIVGRR